MMVLRINWKSIEYFLSIPQKEWKEKQNQWDEQTIKTTNRYDASLTI